MISFILNLIAMILDGQERGDDIQKVIGENYKEICDEIIAEIPKKTVKENVMYALMLTLDIVWIVGIISVIKTLIFMLAQNSKDMTFVFSLGDLISWGMIVFVAYLVVYYICSTTFREKERETNKVLSFIIIWFIQQITQDLLIMLWDMQLLPHHLVLLKNINPTLFYLKMNF